MNIIPELWLVVSSFHNHNTMEPQKPLNHVCRIPITSLLAVLSLRVPNCQMSINHWLWWIFVNILKWIFNKGCRKNLGISGIWSYWFLTEFDLCLLYLIDKEPRINLKEWHSEHRLWGTEYHFSIPGRIQDFKLGGGAHLKKIAPSGGRRDNSTSKLYHLRLRVECTLFVIYKAGREPTPHWW
jgi:hypothetical protein